VVNISDASTPSEDAEAAAMTEDASFSCALPALPAQLVSVMASTMSHSSIPVYLFIQISFFVAA
jgi:uncharacterized membrane protein